MTDATKSLNLPILKGRDLDENDIRRLFDFSGQNLDDVLFFANQVRKEHVGDDVHLRAIIEFSNHCRCHCLYCGLRSENHQLSRYRLTHHEILQSVHKAVASGMKTIILQSGEDPFYKADDIARLVETIKNQFDVAVTLSVGERSHSEYLLWRQAGTDRYLLKHETSDPILYQKLKPEKNLEDRLQCFLDLKDLGFQIGSGNIVGLPGQTHESLIHDILFMKKLDIDMAGIGPFLPHPDTPLGCYPAGSLLQSLQILALTRIVLPTVHLPATTALSTLNKDARRYALEAGANVVMLNFTPLRVRDCYAIYPQKIDIIEKPERSLENLKNLLQEMNRTVSEEFGHALKK